MGFKSFFKSFGSKLVQVFGFVKKVVTDEVFDAAVDHVESIADTQLDNAAKREWVVGKLRAKFPMVPEYVIRLAVELAVTRLKSVVHAGADKAKDA